MTFIEDGNPDYLDEEKTVINFVKMRMIAGVFLNIEKFQRIEYLFQRTKILQEFLANSDVLVDEDDLYKLSTKLAAPANATLANMANSRGSVNAGSPLVKHRVKLGALG